MFEHKTLQDVNDYFVELRARSHKGVYFYRIDGYNDLIKKFILEYYESARLSGVVIEGRIPNPDEKNLSYFEEIMGMDFQMSMGFITSSLNKWLPRMNDLQRNNVAASIYDILDAMRHEGKNDNILRNAYIKFMCWLYYKFERILNQLGNEKLPKILYEGDISNYELKLITILSNAGCDVVLLQYDGDANYLKLDASSKVSVLLNIENKQAFSKAFCIKQIRNEIENQIKIQRLYGTLPKFANCTNAWITGSVFEDMLKNADVRGDDTNLFYNCFYKISGVEDKLIYVNELYQFQLQLKNNNRKMLIIEKEIIQPSMEEISKINHRNYDKQEQMLLDLSNNIRYTQNVELQRLMVKSFIDVFMEEFDRGEANLNKLTNMAVYILCWLRRCQTDLFPNWKMPEIACFIYLGGCKNRTEALFIKMLSRLPVDVLLLVPNSDEQCVLEDSLLYEKKYSTSLLVDKFPRESANVNMGTAAYHAERELDTLMYQDSGIYRNFQYSQAVAVSLKTMYEEVAILWDQELKYRPNFSVVDSIVNMPVIFTKVSGVKDGLINEYWQSIKTLITNDTVIIKSLPYIDSTAENPMKAYATDFYKNSRLQKGKIKEHKAYQYGHLREEMQDYILEKLQLLINQKIIKGTGENGTEYTIISVVLNLDKELIRRIQNFDFTKQNPKLIYINTSEEVISLEDSILTAFLNLLGFDILFFIPTGYQNVEKFFNSKIMEEHQIGEYKHDLNIPNFDSISSNKHPSWCEKIFKRGN